MYISLFPLKFICTSLNIIMPGVFLERFSNIWLGRYAGKDRDMKTTMTTDSNVRKTDGRQEIANAHLAQHICLQKLVLQTQGCINCIFKVEIRLP